MSVPAATATPADSAATVVAPPTGGPAAHMSQFFTKLQEHYKQGKFFDVCVRCIVLPEPDRQQQESESEPASDLLVSSPASPQQHQSQQQEDSGEDGNETEDKDGSVASSPVSPQGGQQQQNEDAGSKPEACTTDISRHVIVLCARSPYFASSLSGKWR